MTNIRVKTDNAEDTEPTGTLLETDKYISEKGTEFVIQPQTNGLYKIFMRKGGISPLICEEGFTSKKMAEAKLEEYIASTDRLGYAVFPSKSKELNGKS